jgi:hypothetical protein
MYKEHNVVIIKLIKLNYKSQTYKILNVKYNLIYMYTKI